MTSDRRDPPDDAALVHDLVQGSESALAALYDRHAASVFASAYRLTSDRGTAEEVVQETFLVVWNRADSFEPTSGSFAAWIHAIARNRSIDRLRAARRRPDLVAMGALAGSDEDALGALDRMAGDGDAIGGAGRPVSPEDAAISNDLQALIRATLDDMSEVERTVILLAYQEELSQAEIADRLGWPLGTVKTRTRRALLRLRTALGADFGPRLDGDVMPVPTGEDG